jgi:sugar lactone lactonase YvrE
MKLTIFHKAESQLAEGPYWSDFHSELFWVDIMTNTLFRKSLQGKLASYTLPETLTSFYVNESVVFGCTNSGFCSFDLDTNQFERIVEIEASNETNRSNDGKYDGQGGFIFGTMDWAGNKCSGSIYHVDTKKLDYTILDAGFYIPNGFALTADSTEILIADSYLKIIYKYNYDPEKRLLKNKRIFADLSSTESSPDGMATSSMNLVWNAEWGGAKLTQYDPGGEKTSQITLPVLNPTSCAFGGENANLLFITSARAEMNEQQLEKYPDSGSVLCLDLNG